MLGLMLLVGCAAFVVYKVAKAAAKHPEAAAGVGQFVFKMLKK